MVLTLVIVTDEAAQYDAVRAASEAAREHPCRVLAVITRRPQAASRLDAEIRVGEAGPGETVLLRMYGPIGAARGLGGHPAAGAGHPGGHLVAGDRARRSRPADPLGALAQRRITDAAAAGAPHDALATLAARLPARGHRPELDPGHAVAVAAGRHDGPAARRRSPAARSSAEAGNPSADLIAAWLSRRLGVAVRAHGVRRARASPR